MLIITKEELAKNYHVTPKYCTCKATQKTFYHIYLDDSDGSMVQLNTSEEIESITKQLNNKNLIGSLTELIAI